jgi:hypothetical protein
MKVLNIRTSGVLQGAVSVMRPSVFGNPYVIGPDGDRAEVVRKFEIDFLERIRLDQSFRAAVLGLRGAAALVCCCAPLKCHADVIARWLVEQKEV